MAGWVLIDSKTQQPYAWTVRCPEHSPTDAGWEPLELSECPTEAACEECGQFLA